MYKFKNKLQEKDKSPGVDTYLKRSISNNWTGTQKWRFSLYWPCCVSLLDMATVVHVPVFQQMAAIPIIVRKSLFIYFAILRICLIEKKKNITTLYKGWRCLWSYVCHTWKRRFLKSLLSLLIETFNKTALTDFIFFICVGI